jgi:hypothetical protein
VLELTDYVTLVVVVLERTESFDSSKHTTSSLIYCFFEFSFFLILDFFSLFTVENLSAMDDILIVTAKQSEPGILWVNYLKTCFDKITKQRGRLPFK